MKHSTSLERCRGRKRTGSLEWRGKTWHARLTVTEDTAAGPITVRKRVDLGTDNKSAARRALARLLAEPALLAQPAAAPAALRETIDTYAVSWLESRKARGIAAADYETRLYNRIWKPVLGSLTFDAKGIVALVRETLDRLASGKVRPLQRKNQSGPPRPYSRQSVAHIRAVAFRLFDAAWRDELLSENPIARVSIPEMEQSSKARAILTDDEIAQLVNHRDVDAEIKLLVLLARTVAGLRSGDLNALDWSAFSPGYETCTFVRRKTRKKRPRPETHEVPAAVRPFLAAWHEAQRRSDAPLAPSGSVFPVRVGDRAGQAKKRSNMSYADRLRRELQRAGVTRHELHHETSTTLPVDFHSTRRAYATALVRSGASDRETMKLGGWSTPALITRYDEKDAVRALPAAAIPALIVPAENRPIFGTILAEDLFCTGFAFSDFCRVSIGAGHAVRTRDPELGKLVLYQLS